MVNENFLVFFIIYGVFSLIVAAALALHDELSFREGISITLFWPFIAVYIFLLVAVLVTSKTLSRLLGYELRFHRTGKFISEKKWGFKKGEHDGRRGFLVSFPFIHVTIIQIRKKSE